MTDFVDLTEQLERVYTARLALRPVALCDAWPLFEATKNPHFNGNLLWPQPQEDLSVLERVQMIMDASRRGRMTALSAVVKATGEWVSLYRFQPYEADSSRVEMGIWTHEKFWHDQYSFELTQACIDSTFVLSDIPLLIAGASPDNVASCRILERCGMTPSSIAYRHSELKVERKSQEFQITRAHWLKRCARQAFGYVAESTNHGSVSGSAGLSHQPGIELVRQAQDQAISTFEMSDPVRAAA